MTGYILAVEAQRHPELELRCFYLRRLLEILPDAYPAAQTNSLRNGMSDPPLETTPVAESDMK